MDTIDVLSAGAAKGLVHDVEDAFRTQSGANLRTVFGPAATIRERCLGGEPYDVVILTAAMVQDLVEAGAIPADTVAQIGAVRTGIAVRSGVASPPIDRAATLRRTLLEASALYCPDTQRATSGVHFLSVLDRLGISDAVRERVVESPNGSAAMHGLAESQGTAIGFTQISEILESPGVDLVGPLPDELGLVTVYAVGVSGLARQPKLAQAFATLVTGPATVDLRRSIGFDVPN